MYAEIVWRDVEDHLRVASVHTRWEIGRVGRDLVVE